MVTRALVGSVCLVAAAATSCGKSDSKNEEEGANTVKVGDVAVGENALAALNLSASLTPEVPESVTAKGQGVQPGQIAVAMLTNAERKKSQEACNIRQKIKQAQSDQIGIAMQLCFIESQKGMKLGGKYRMKFSPSGGAPMLTQAPSGPGDMPSDPGDMPSGPGDMPSGPGEGDMPSGGGMSEMVMSVFLDNSDPEAFKVYTCNNDILNSKIVLNDARSGVGSKGSYKMLQDNEMGKAAIEGYFDNGVTVAGHQRAASTASFVMSMGTTKMYGRSNMMLDLAKDGISQVKVASEMSMNDGDFGMANVEIGAARIGPNLGSALFQYTMDTENPPMQLKADRQVATNRSWFDSAGQELAEADSDSFKAGGALHVSESDFLKLPRNDFTVAFEPGDWDCSGTEDLAMDTTSDAFKQCSEKFVSSFLDEQCDDAAYGVGAAQQDVPVIIEERETSIPELGPPTEMNPDQQQL